MKHIKPFSLFENTKIDKEKIIDYSKNLFIKKYVDAPTLIYAIDDDFIDIEDAKELIPKLSNVNVISNLKLHQLGVFSKKDLAKFDNSFKYENNDLYIEFSMEDLHHFIKKDDRKSIERVIYYEQEDEWANNNWSYYHGERKYYFENSWDKFDDDVLEEIKNKMIGVEINLEEADLEDVSGEYVVSENDFVNKQIKINDKLFNIEDVIMKCDEFDDKILLPFTNAYSEAKASADASAAFNSVMNEIEKKIGPFQRDSNENFVFEVFKMKLSPSWVLGQFEEDNGKYQTEYVSGKTIYKLDYVDYNEDSYGSYKYTLYEFADREDLVEYDEPYNGWDEDVDDDYLNEVFSDRLQWD